MFKAAIFDLDGTVTDTMAVSAAAFIETLGLHLGREYTAEDIFAMFGPPEEVIFEQLKPGHAQAIMTDYLQNYRKVHPKLASIYPGMIDLLNWLAEHNIPKAIVTGKGKEATLITLKILGLTETFSLVVTGSCVECPKPSPQGILAVLETLAVNPDQAFYLGDSPGDIAAAHGAGVTALAALWGSRNQEALLASRPDHSFVSPTELLAWLQGQLVKRP